MLEAPPHACPPDGLPLYMLMLHAGLIKKTDYSHCEFSSVELFAKVIIFPLGAF